MDPNANKFNILRRIQVNQFSCIFRANGNKNDTTIFRPHITSINIKITKHNLRIKSITIHSSFSKSNSLKFKIKSTIISEENLVFRSKSTNILISNSEIKRRFRFFSFFFFFLRSGTRQISTTLWLKRRVNKFTKFVISNI